MTKQSL